MRFLNIIILLFITTNLKCQVSNPDSLLSLIHSDTFNTSQTIIRYQQLAGYFWRSKADTSLYFAERAFSLASRVGDEIQMAYSNYLKGNVYLDKNEIQKSRFYYESAIKVFEKANDEEKLMKLYGNYGNTFNFENDLVNAEIWFKKGLACAKKINNKRGIAFFSNNIGMLLDSKGYKEEAIKSYLESMKILEEIGDIKSLGQGYHNIGAIYSNLGEKQKALEFTLKAKEYYIKSNNLKSLNNANLNICYYYNELGSIELAENLLSEIYNTKFPLIEPQKATILLLKGQILEKKKKYAAAIPILNECIKVSQKGESLINEHNAIATLARIRLDQKYYDEALKFGTEALAIANRMKDAVSISNDQKVLSKIHAGNKNFVAAFEKLEEFEQGRDSLASKERMTAIHSMEEKFENDKKQKAIEQQQKIISKQSWTTNLIGISFLLSLALVYFLYNRSKEKVKISELLEKQNQILQNNNNELTLSLKEIKNEPNKQLEKLYVTLTGNGKEVVNIADIIYIEADSNSVELFTKDGKKYYDWQKLKYYKELLEPTGIFLQIHRSYIINFNYITSKKSNDIILNYSKNLSIGKTYKEEVHKWLEEKII